MDGKENICVYRFQKISFWSGLIFTTILKLVALIFYAVLFFHIPKDFVIIFLIYFGFLCYLFWILIYPVYAYYTYYKFEKNNILEIDLEKGIYRYITPQTEINFNINDIKNVSENYFKTYLMGGLTCIIFKGEKHLIISDKILPTGHFGYYNDVYSRSIKITEWNIMPFWVIHLENIGEKYAWYR